MSAKLIAIPEKNEDNEDCHNCTVLEENIKTITERIHILERFVFWGKLKDFVFDSLSHKDAFVQIGLIDGKKFQIPVNIKTTVKELKVLIKEQEDIDVDRGRLIFNNTIMPFYRTLLGLGIPSRGVVHLAMNSDKNYYPPLEELTADHRKEIMEDEYLFNEHSLKRNQDYHAHMKKKHEDYLTKKKAYFDSLQEN